MSVATELLPIEMISGTNHLLPSSTAEYTPSSPSCSTPNPCNVFVVVCRVVVLNTGVSCGGYAKCFGILGWAVPGSPVAKS
jgi:hypothetical protein